MAKAIYGHLDPGTRTAAEVARLRARVRDLEAEVARLRAEAELASIEGFLVDELLVPDPR